MALKGHLTGHHFEKDHLTNFMLDLIKCGNFTE